MVVSGVLAMLLWGVFAGLQIYGLTLAAAVFRGADERLESALWWSRALMLSAALLSVVTGLGLAFGAFASCGPLYLAGLYHWTGLTGAALGFAAFFLLPVLVRAILGEDGVCSEPSRWWVTLIVCGSSALVWSLAWLIPYLILSGSINESAYPDRAKSPYKLPFPGGESSWVIQGNNSGLNHNGTQQFAYDFRRRCGSPVLAACAGVIADFDASNDGNGSGATNNFIAVKHDDQTVAKYLHILKNSVTLKKGARVTQGQEIAKVGNVGNSLTGHIHFIVIGKDGKNTAATFQDVKDDAGIPRTFSSYESGNK